MGGTFAMGSGSLKPVRFDAPGVRVKLDEFRFFSVKYDSSASAVDFVHGIRSLKSHRGLSIRPEIDGKRVNFGRHRESTDFVRFAKWFQRHIEETDRIDVLGGHGKITWQSPLSRERSEANDLMSGRLNTAAVTFSGTSIDQDLLDELMVKFDVITSDEHVDAADAFMKDAGVSTGTMFPSFGLISIV